jgi:hypothetical protein
MPIERHLGNLKLRFEGPTHWTRKAAASFDAQIVWLNRERGDIFFPEKRQYTFCPPLDGQIGTSLDISGTEIKLSIDRWYKANSSIIFQLEAIRQNALLLHGNSFTLGGAAHVFAADGGVGKTSMLLCLKAMGSYDTKFVGDDLVWLTDRGQVLPYLRPMCVYRYHYRTFRSAFGAYRTYFVSPSIFAKGIRLIVRNIAAVLNVDHSAFDRRFVPSDGYTLVPIADVFTKFADANPNPLNTLNYLQKGEAFSVVVTDHEALLAKAQASLLKEFREYSTLLNEACTALHGLSFADYAKAKLTPLIEDRQGLCVTTNGQWTPTEIDALIEALAS